MGKLFPGQDIKWGLGFLINPQESRTGQSGGSVSWSGFANTYFWLDPVKRIAGVYLTQLLPFLDSSVLDDYSAKESSAYASRR
jgi:CubicO group peptidase (beta-lactamase class C family)